MGLVTAPACRQPAYCDNHRMQKACMCSLTTLLNQYSAKTMRDCGESFLPSIQGRLETLALRRLRRSLAKCQACCDMNGSVPFWDWWCEEEIYQHRFGSF